jgi:hypothetical protein
MAKHVINEAYTFTPSSRTITVVGKTIRREQLVLILNVTTNTVIYNFADTSLTATAYSISNTNNVETTSIVLNYNTTGMSSGDKLSIIVDETYETFQPSETLQDPVGKLRVSQPQSLIDTDFEYGTQPSKWETLTLMNNRPAAFYDNTSPITFTGISGAGTRVVTVTLASTAGITTSTPVYIQDSTDPVANGWYLPASVSANANFTYIARANVTNGNIFDTTKTYIYIGTFFTQSAITVSASSGAAFTASTTAITCTTTYNHGLSVGDAIYVVGTTAATSNPPNGAWFVRQTPTSNTFIFDVVTAPVGAITAAAGATSTVYVRPWGNSTHRAFDGGVNFTAGTPFHGNQLIRQTRRYFRYQSGKGIQFSTGSNVCAPYLIDNITGSGTTVTVNTKFPHNLWIGASVKVSGGVLDTAYNGNFTVVSVPSDTSFTYTASTSITTSPSPDRLYVQPYQWYGAAVRLGLFDQQNGFFFEYDGQTLYACRRASVYQPSGYISALTNGAQAVTGVGTLFSKQLSPQDQIVIRGMSYTVVSIESDTAMTIYPEYKGTSISSPSQVIFSKTDTLRIPQSSWNIDKADGTGESGINIDITKMQMWYIDYTWYGAGAIRWGFKDARGNVRYVHRLAHANQQTEAYMRSGNIPARYEVSTIAPTTKITATVANTEVTTMNVASTTGFPVSGTLVIAQSGNTGANIEYISYTGKTSTTFTGLTRQLTNLAGPGGLASGGGTGTAATFTYSATAPIGVSLHSPQTSNTIGHWGSSVIMDGRYDDDKSLVFVAGASTSVANIGAGVIQPLISMRISPSVDNGITGVLGQREIINRMQLVLRGCDAFTTGTNMTFLITLRLNGAVSGGTFAAAGGSSLAQIAYHTSGQTISGGETVFGFFTTTPGVTSADLTGVRDLGNSILGGGNTLSVPTSALNKYPDGPDVITVCAQNVTSIGSNSINARISWTEAQA